MKIDNTLSAYIGAVSKSDNRKQRFGVYVGFGVIVFSILGKN